MNCCFFTEIQDVASFIKSDNKERNSSSICVNTKLSQGTDFMLWLDFLSFTVGKRLKQETQNWRKLYILKLWLKTQEWTLNVKSLRHGNLKLGFSSIICYQLSQHTDC